MNSITPRQLLGLIRDDKEIAIIDVREQGEFANAHLLLSCCIPLSRMELRIAELIPRLDTPMVLVGNEPADAYRRTQRAFDRLNQWGYTDLSVLAGGIEGWRQAGYLLFSGVNTLSKAFGEFVETTYDTPRISAQALWQKIKQGEDLVILDARPAEEYFRMNIPGAVNVPGAEIVYRFFDFIKNPETLVVVNCAGRTRSIIGAQSLINAGIPNPVMALKNGTMGWHLDGLELENGQRRSTPFLTPAGMERAKTCVRRVADRFGVKQVDRATVAEWENDAGGRTCYVLDVRSPEEYTAGHLAGSRNASGGQLVQATDEYVAVRNARIVLVDDTEIRAIMTASWLVQMGWKDVFVLSGGIGNAGLEERPYHQSIIADYKEVRVISAGELNVKLSDESVAVIDVGTSRTYRTGHIPGAYWVVRSRMVLDIAALPGVEQIVLTASDDRLAHLAAEDLKAIRPDAAVRVLSGGASAWQNAGFPVEKGTSKALSTVDDVWYKPYELATASENAMTEYLNWEVGLVEQIKKDGSVVFPRF
ncbi:MAG: rhodanese-like domain-containing protein [Desulfobacterales bacterium]|nr:rhodanese-like domain-containing protein [Desulfobacterales bacterium]